MDQKISIPIPKENVSDLSWRSSFVDPIHVNEPRNVKKRSQFSC